MTLILMIIGDLHKKWVGWPKWLRSGLGVTAVVFACLFELVFFFAWSVTAWAAGWFWFSIVLAILALALPTGTCVAAISYSAHVDDQEFRARREDLSRFGRGRP